MATENERSYVNIARQLINTRPKAALGTIDRRSGAPSVSLIAVAALDDHRPFFLISTLAEHTANLQADPRASLLFDDSGEAAARASARRLTLIGTARPLNADLDEFDEARSRYLERHPDAAIYVDFADFAFYVLEPQRAHFVGGFGKISSIRVEALIGSGLRV